VLLEAGADAIMAADNGVTPLQIATECGHPAVVKMLLEVGADANKAFNKNGCTPLQVAVHCGHLAVVKALLETGADAKVMNNDGVTALSIAMRSGEAAIVAALQRHDRSG